MRFRLQRWLATVPQPSVAGSKSKKQAQAVAQCAAALLKAQFQATPLVLFGSLAHGRWFSHASDMDLAAWGMASEDDFRAVAQLQDLSSDFNIDLVAMEHRRPSLRAVIEAEGQAQ